MKSDCYKVNKPPRPDEMMFILVPHGQSVDALPDQIKQAAGGFAFDKTVEIDPAGKMDCFDVGKAAQDLAEQGYHLIVMKQ